MSNASSTESFEPAARPPFQVEVGSPSLPLWAWVTAAAVCTLGAYLLLFYHWAIVANPLVWTLLVAPNGDDRAYVAAKVLSGELRNADIVLLGTSATRYAFWPEPILEAALRQRGERDAKIVNLSSALQSPIESLFLTTIGETRRNQLFVLFMSPGMFQAEPFAYLERGYFLLPPEHLIAAHSPEGLYPKYWTSWSFRMLARWRALRERLLRFIDIGFRSQVGRAVYNTPVPPYRLYVERETYDAGTRASYLAAARLRFERHSAANLAYLAQTLDVLTTAIQQRGSRLVIAHSPDVDRYFETAYPQEHEKFETILRNLHITRRVELLDLNPRMDWTEGDFLDYGHLAAHGRDKWSVAFVDWLRSQR